MGNTAEKDDHRLPWRMLGWLFVTQIAVAFVGRSLAPLGPRIAEDLNLTKAQVGTLTAAVFLGQSLTSLPSGYLADRLGSRRMLAALTLLLGLSFALASFTNRYAWIVALAAIGGLGYGAMHPTSNRGILYWFPLERRGTAMGLKQMGVTAGSALAVIVLFPLALHAGWRAALLVAALTVLATGLIATWHYRDPEKGQHGLPFDRASDPSFSWSATLSLFRSCPLWGISLAALFLTGAQMSLTAYVVFYGQEHMGYPPYAAGLLLFLSEVGGSVGRVAWGFISDRAFRGDRWRGLMIIAVSTFALNGALALLPAKTSFYLTAFIVGWLGLTVVGFNGLWMVQAAESAPKSLAGLASGLSLSIGSLGVVLIPPVFGWILDRTGGYRWAWGFLAMLALIAGGWLIFARKSQNTVSL
ncbi:hypothetical protein TR75_12900 [Hydrogenibacillus schlegelii]|uniref:MFS transporter n=1 Tax=Hydrogenibacillus schlegelii TaxID=1484 RepID=UPI00079B8BAF|nr:MFS transporter [Hydrogenibacillus schlegelii]KWW96729.1 hypothetical protein TR75_12900 [Hydrogenibacillus schlegelii]